MEAPPSLRRGRHLGPGAGPVVGRGADAAGTVDWRVSVDATITRAHQHATNTIRPDQGTGGSLELQRICLAACEPAGHGIGRSRGGLSSKIHAGVDGHGRPLALVVTGGQRNDGPPRRATSGAGRLSLQGTQRRRTLLRPGQAVEGTGHPIRQARHHLPRRRHPVRVHHLDPHTGEPTTSTSFPRT